MDWPGLYNCIILSLASFCLQTAECCGNVNLKWNPHTQYIANKISRTIGVLNKLKHYLPFKIRKLLYNSLILSHLQYGVLVWGYEMWKLIKIQKRAIRILNNSKYNSHTEPLFKKNNLLKLPDILKLNELKFYYKYEKRCLPFTLQSLPLNPNSVFHQHDTRSKNKIHLTKVNHEFAKKCIRYSIPDTINDMPTSIIQKIYTHSMHSLGNYYKKYTISQYQSDCYIINCYICRNR